MPPFNYTPILAISTAAFAGVTFGTLVNRWSENHDDKINDYHVHMMSPQLFNIMNSKWQQLEPSMNIEPNLNAKQLIEQMKQFNISKSLIVSSAYLYTSQTAKYLNYDEIQEEKKVQTENNYIYNQCDQYGHELISSFSIHPLKSYTMNEVKRCLNQNNNKICKLHFSNSNINLRNNHHLQKIKFLFQTIAENDGSILLHFDNCYMDDTEFGDNEDIKEYVTLFMNECVIPHPKLKILFAHLGGFGGFNKRTADIFESILSIVIDHKLNDRIYFDISSIFFKEKPIEIVPALEEKKRLKQLLETMDDNNMLNQLLYGSDYPFVEHRKYLAETKELWPLSSQKLDAILSNDFIPF